MRQRLLWLPIILIGTPSLLGFLSRYAWAFELMSHFRPHYAASLGLTAALTLRHRRDVGLSAALLAILNTLPIAPLYLGDAPSTNHHGPRVTLVFANVLSINTNHDALLSYLDDASPDLIAVAEVSQRWRDVLSRHLTDHPHRVVVPRNDNFGLALYSRLPILDQHTLTLGPREFPALVVTLDLDGTPITLAVAHPIPPVTPTLLAERDAYLKHVAKNLATFDTPRILTGDLNLTSWSALFDDVLHTANLLDARAGFGIQATWPSGLGRFGLPLDHALVSDHWQVLSHDVGPSFGSDHRPIRVVLGL